MTSHFKDFYHNVLLARVLFQEFLKNESKNESKYEFRNAIVKCKTKQFKDISRINLNINRDSFTHKNPAFSN